MARISKGKFRNLRDHFASQKYFTVTRKNINTLKIMLGDDIKVGEQYIMRDVPLSDEVIAAFDAGSSSVNGKPIDTTLAGKLVDNFATKRLMERQARWAE